MIFRFDDVSVDTDVTKLKEISDIIGGQQIFAITPFGDRHGSGETPFNENGDLYCFVKGKPEIALHGYRHIPVIEGKTEDNIWEIVKARDYLEKILDKKVNYFVPPKHLINSEIHYWLEAIGLEVMIDKNSEDLDELVNEYKPPRLDTRIVWLHWWKTDTEKLKKWLKKYQN